MLTKDKVERAAAFFERLAEKVKDPNEKLTLEEKQEFEDLGLGTIDLEAQTISMDPTIAHAIRRIAQDAAFLETLPEDLTKH